MVYGNPEKTDGRFRCPVFLLQLLRRLEVLLMTMGSISVRQLCGLDQTQ